ncbi:MAG: hypothetical protein D6791_13760 [Chloroflexi bacterium]|nr:MAG: hypothetical protein D6791_13760 [Chloroflexota bacterium]
MGGYRMIGPGRVLVLGVLGLLLSLVISPALGVTHAQSRNTLECIETQFTAPEYTWVTDACYTDQDGNCTEEIPEAWADRLTGRIWYTSQDGTEEVLDLSLDAAFRYRWPMAIFVNEHFWGVVQNLVGHQFQELQATKVECVYNPGAGPWMKMYTYWVIRAKLAERGGGGSGGGGGGNAGNLAQFEGFINQIAGQEVTLAKEGRSVTVTVTDETTITLNGASATLDDLRVGYKAKATYDAGTNEASQIKAEAER